MAGRPLKEGLDYFPVDIDIMDEDSILNVEMEYGVVAFGVLMRLLLRIYRNGYYTKWSKKELFTFAQRDIGMELSLTENIVTAYINEGFFDKNLWITHGILTSRGIQKRFLRVANRREKVVMIKEFFLLDISVDDNCKNIILKELSTTEINISVDNNSIQEELPPYQNTTSRASRVSKVSKANIVTSQINTPPVDNFDSDSLAALALPDLLKTVKKKLPDCLARQELEKETVLLGYLSKYSPVVISCALDDMHKRSGQSLAYFDKILSDYPMRGSEFEKDWLRQNKQKYQRAPDCPKCDDEGHAGYVEYTDDNGKTSLRQCDCWAYRGDG